MPTDASPGELSPEYLYEYVGTKLIVIASIFIPLEVLFVALRTYSRSLVKSRMGVDDVLIWFSLLVCLVLCIESIAMVKYGGVGRHVAALEALGRADQVVIWAKMLIAAEWLYLCAAALPKLCVLSLYLRIFVDKRSRMACYVLGVVILATFIGGGLTGSLGCQPLEYFWNKKIVGGHCINTNAFFRWISFPNILTDIAMLGLPLPLVWKLQASKGQKIGLTVTFLTGSVGLVASLIRFAMFFGDDAVSDGTYASANLMIMTCVEPGIYLIAACLVTLRPLLQRLVKETTLATMGGGTWNYEETSSDHNDTKLATLKGTAPSSRRGISAPLPATATSRNQGVSHGYWDSDDHLVANPVYAGNKNGYVANVESRIVVQSDFTVTSSN